MIRERFDDEPASVVAGSFTLQGSRGGSTVVHFFFGFIYNIQKSSEHNRRCSMIVEVNLVCLHIQESSERNNRRSKILEANPVRQKFQVQFELQIAIGLRNDDVTITNRSRITFELEM